MSDSEWRPIPGFEGYYEVSRSGLVRSLDRYTQTIQGPLFRHGQQLKPQLKGGVGDRRYLTVTLCHPDHKRRWWYVHRLVLMAFVGPCTDGREGCHRDGDPSNNSVENLYWGTKSENTFDSVKHGTQREARKTHCPQGHPYDTENTFRYQGFRHCRTCRAWRHERDAARRRMENAK